jgi:hypothetical protein
MNGVAKNNKDQVDIAFGMVIYSMIIIVPIHHYQDFFNLKTSSSSQSLPKFYFSTTFRQFPAGPL